MKKSKKSLKMNDPLKDDLSELLLKSDWQFIKFEMTEKKDKVLSLRLSEKLLEEIKKQAKMLGLDTQKFIRLVLEKSIQKNKASL